MKMSNRNGNKDKSGLELEEILRLSITTFLVTMMLLHIFMVKTVVPTGSMIPTLNIEDEFLVDRVIFRINGIERGNILVFEPPIGAGTEKLVKRAIGLPGETIEGIDGYVYINGVKLEEDYVADTLAEDFGPYTIPDKSYFMLGDNRRSSFDSRYWEDKFVSYSDIFGQLYCRYKGGIKVYMTPKYNIN